ncbi:MAG TPA: M48 family metallopeptidase, partial [Gammaproteobacteria bacterium]|nr:M48 family metallopeptidase [Gammaproteobacteria bacterium]
MKYENPTVPEGINASHGYPLKRLVFLFGGLVMLLIVVIFSLRLMTEWMAPHVPFAYERWLVERYLPKENDDESHARLLSYLQWLAQRLSKVANLPDDMTVTIHYRDDPTVNAVATLGGHIVIYRGLLERLESENALAMVMAHEIAHIKRRHPLINLGSGTVFGLVVAIITGSTGDAVTGRVIGQLGAVADSGFSREQEWQA